MLAFVKKIALFFYALFIVAVLGLLAFFSLGMFIHLSYRTPQELGEEVVATFPSWMPEVIAKNSLRISPAVEGQSVWFENERELHFIPTRGFDPAAAYHATVSIAPPSSPLLAQLTFPTTTLTFQSPFVPTPSKTENFYTPKIEQGKFIDINLEKMRMTLFEDGKAVKSYPLAAKGNPKVAPTREGVFTVLSKEPRHFALREHLWMPWSMQFSGDYFIHGWPYWPDGVPLKSTYSAGCVRLQTPDAREVFNWADKGTAVAVHSTPAYLLFPEASVQDGDLVREIGDYRVYVVKKAGAKRFKRHVTTEQFSEWYPQLAPFTRRLNVLEPGALSSYTLSRWIRLEGDAHVYEVDDTNKKHELECASSSGCLAEWTKTGWDMDEVYVVSKKEFNFYKNGKGKELKPLRT